jgi:hypothetical protein
MDGEDTGGGNLICLRGFNHFSDSDFVALARDRLRWGIGNAVEEGGDVPDVPVPADNGHELHVGIELLPSTVIHCERLLGLLS